MAEPRADLADSHAILIGTARYRDERFLPLPAVVNSLNGMSAMLRDPGLGGWPGESVIEIPDPENPQDLVLRIRDIAMRTTGTLLLYFVGHGELTPKSELALTVVNTVFGHEDVTGVEYTRVRDALLDSPARVKMVILDCCYSGKVPASLSAASFSGLTEISGTCTLTAAEYAAHVLPLDEQEHATTSFTGELLTLVREGVAGGPSWLTVGDLYPELRRRLRARGLPEPSQQGSDTVHQFPFARNAGALGAPEPLPGFVGRPVKRRRRRGRVAVSAIAAVSAIVAVTALVAENWPDGHHATDTRSVAAGVGARPSQSPPSDTTPPYDCPQYQMCFYTGDEYNGDHVYRDMDYSLTSHCQNTEGVFRSVFNNADQSQRFWPTKDCSGGPGRPLRYGTGESHVLIRSFKHS